MNKNEIELYLDRLPKLKTAIGKTASNPLENAHFVTLIETALKGLEYVGYGTMDWKLLSIIELIRAWMKEKQEELKSSKKNTNLGNGIYY